jgi:hypothetical protein
VDTYRTLQKAPPSGGVLYREVWSFVNKSFFFHISVGFLDAYRLLVNNVHAAKVSLLFFSYIFSLKLKEDSCQNYPLASIIFPLRDRDENQLIVTEDQRCESRAKPLIESKKMYSSHYHKSRSSRILYKYWNIARCREW